MRKCWVFARSNLTQLLQLKEEVGETVKKNKKKKQQISESIISSIRAGRAHFGPTQEVAHLEWSLAWRMEDVWANQRGSQISKETSSFECDNHVGPTVCLNTTLWQVSSSNPVFQKSCTTGQDFKNVSSVLIAHKTGSDTPSGKDNRFSPTYTVTLSLHAKSIWDIWDTKSWAHQNWINSLDSCA